MITATATIFFGNDDDFQDVIFEYDYTKDWTGFYYVKQVQLKLKLFGHAEYLTEDIEIAIAEDLGVNANLVQLDCEIQHVKELNLNKLAA